MNCQRFLLWLLCIASFPLKGQQLISSFPNLNPGGVINDIVIDTTQQIAYLAGDFTSIGGVSRRNLAAVQLSTNSVISSFNPISTMIGSILSIEKYGTKLYIGGNFTSINGNGAYAYFRRVDLNASGNSGTHSSAFNPGTNNTVNDLAIDGTTLYIVSDDLAIDDAITGETRLKVGAINAANGTTLNFNPSNLSSNFTFTWGSCEIKKLVIDGSNIYLCGRNFGGPLNNGIIAINKSSGVYIPSFNPSFTYENVIDAVIINNSLLLVNSKIWPAGFALMEFNKSTGTMINTAFSFGGGAPEGIESYKNQLFIAGNFTSLNGVNRNYFCSYNTVTECINSFSPQPNAAIDKPGQLKLLQNKLFVSDNSLSTISSTSKTGIALYCLEPHDPGIINISSTNLCPEQTGINAFISTVPYANSYQWIYSGNGLNPQPNGTSCTISTGINFSSGILSVIAFSECNLPSDTSTIQLTRLSPPDIEAGNDTSITCINPIIQLTANSTAAGINLGWNDPLQNFSTGSFISCSLAGNYIAIGTDPNTGCIGRDTLTVISDTIAPTPLLPVGTFILTCVDSTLILSGNAVPINSITSWSKYPGQSYSDPFSCSEPGLYYLIAENTINGCKDSAGIFIDQNIVSPEIFIDFPIAAGFIVDTINCQDSLALVSVSSFQNQTTFYWHLNGNTEGSGNNIEIFNGGLWTVTGTDTLNGCESDLVFFIYENKIAPESSIEDDTLWISCSRDSISITPFIPTNGDFISINYPIVGTEIAGSYLSQEGWHYVSITDPENLCSLIDSFLLKQNNQIEFSGPNDTIVCKGTLIQLDAQPMGVSQQATYYWSIPQSYNESPIVQVLSDSIFSLYVSDSICEGEYEIAIRIPENRNDSITSFLSCNPLNLSGSIYINSSGGLPPFQYSINNESFQSSGYFSNLSLGEHHIIIKDSLLCIDTIYVSLNENASSPKTEFMVDITGSTFDTLVLVNTSFPVPDTSIWNFPHTIHVVQINEEALHIHKPDSGNVFIELTGIVNGCTTSVSRNIMFVPTDPNNQELEAKPTISIYPNPAIESTTVLIDSDKQQWIQIELKSLSGISAFHRIVFITNTTSIQIPLSDHPPGTYTLQCTGENWMNSQLLILLPD